MSSITWLTVRVRVHVPGGHKLPDRVRVIVKERGALLFPFQHKLMSIPLYKARWVSLEGKVQYNEQAMAVPVEVGKLLKRAKKQRLALQLYCLRGRTVQHKALGEFARLMQQVRDDELLLALHYPDCARHQKTFPAPRGECHNAVPCNPSPAPAAAVTGGQQQGCGAPVSANDSVQEVTDYLERAAPLPTEPSHAPPLRVRFPDSGSVFVELLKEHDTSVAQEEDAAKKASEERAAAAATERKQTSKQLTVSRWRRRLHILGAAAALVLASALVVLVLLPQLEIQSWGAMVGVVLLLLVELAVAGGG